MSDISRNPVHPEISPASSRSDLQDVGRAPVLVTLLGAALAFVVCAAIFAFGQVGMGITAVSAGLLAFAAGLSWLSMERRRVRDAERHLVHPEHR